MNQTHANAAVERAARESYARLLALIAVRTRDIHAAEDALSEALASALVAWTRDGLPDNPDAWLITVARRRLIDEARSTARARTRQADPDQMIARLEDLPTDAPVPDERLRLMFVCAHPAIDETVRTALMLQCVLGIDITRIASRFLISPDAMKQRLARAKRKIRDAGIPTDLPDRAAMRWRLEDVLRAIYAAFDTAAESAADPERPEHELAAEALHLARLLARHLPDEPEALGLLALLCHIHARRDARRSTEGAYVPLDRQDAARWDARLLDEGDDALRRAAGLGIPARYQIEAAIQSALAHAARHNADTTPAVLALYDMLVSVHPTIGASVARAAAIGRLVDPDAGLAALDAIDPQRVTDHQPYHAVKGMLAQRAGRAQDATASLDRAIALTADPAVRAYLALHRPA